MKGLIYTLMLLAVPLFGAAQQYQMLPNFYRPLNPSAIEQNKDAGSDPVDFNMSVGTGFSSFAGQSTLNSWLAPSVGYQVNPNLRLQFTGVLANTNALSTGSAPVPAGQKGMMPYNTGGQSFSFSGEGIYQPNENFYIRAGGTYADQSMTPFNLYPQDNRISSDYKSIHLGMGYKISESSSIQFQMQLSEGYNPYGNPHMNSSTSFFAPRHGYAPAYHPYPW